MPFGQSTFLAVMGHGITKRVSYLAVLAATNDRRKADHISDEISIAAASTVGTAASVATVDPLGFSGTAAYCAMLAHEQDMKKSVR
jgi:hypothetical protein